MTNLRVWIKPLRVWIKRDLLVEFAATQSQSYRCFVHAFSFPGGDLYDCYELVPVSREQLEREAAEGIKQIDEEGEK